MEKAKYLWAMALIAVWLSLGASAAFGVQDWTVLDQTFPATLEWDRTADASIDAENTGDEPWGQGFGLVSVEGITTTATPTDRWGLELVSEFGVTVAVGMDFLFEFTITAPPITSLMYIPPVGPTEPGVVSAFDCNWIFAIPITPTPTPITTTTVISPIVVSRFPDIQTGTLGAWARFQTEELAGRVPFVVQGFEDGTYRPKVEVSRDQMAVFVARALKLPTGPFQGEFSDVNATFWARPEIEALVATDIVEGFEDGTYRPANIVSRDQMAVFMARSIAGGESLVPTGPATATFPDVPTNWWAFDHVEFAVAEGVVKGYEDGSYRPLDNVTRDQMAVFIWRTFIMPSDPGAAVVLAGPAITSVDVDSADYVGYTSILAGPQADPGFAYVGLDAMRLGTGLVFPQTPTGTWEVELVLLPLGSPTPAASVVFELTAGDISAAKAAAASTGDPYLFLSWDIPSGLPRGDYVLKAEAEDETGTFYEVRRTPPVSADPTEVPFRIE